MDAQMKWIVDHQKEWGDLYNAEKRRRYIEKSRAEKQRVKDRKAGQK